MHGENYDYFWPIMFSLVSFVLIIGSCLLFFYKKREASMIRQKWVGIEPDQKLVSEVQRNLWLLADKPENNSGLALYQVQLFEEDLKVILNSVSIRLNERLSMLIDEINEFINHRDDVLSKVKEDVLKESYGLSSGIGRSINRIRSLVGTDTVLNDEISETLLSVQKDAERLRNKSVILACEVDKQDDIRETLAILQGILEKMEELALEADTLFKARDIVKKYRTG